MKNKIIIIFALAIFFVMIILPLFAQGSIKMTENKITDEYVATGIASYAQPTGGVNDGD